MAAQLDAPDARRAKYRVADLPAQSGAPDAVAVPVPARCQAGGLRARSDGLDSPERAKFPEAVPPVRSDVRGSRGSAKYRAARPVRVQCLQLG